MHTIVSVLPPSLLAKSGTVPAMRRQQERIANAYAKTTVMASKARTVERETELSRKLWAMRYEWEALEGWISARTGEPRAMLPLV